MAKVSLALKQRMMKGCADKAAMERFYDRVTAFAPSLEKRFDRPPETYDELGAFIIYIVQNVNTASFSNNFFRDCRDIVLADMDETPKHKPSNPYSMEEDNMFKPETKTAMNKAYSNTLDAAKLAAELSLGETAIAAIARAVKPTLPLLVRPYADHAAAQALIANAGAFLLELVMPNDPRVARVVAAVRIASFTKIVHDANVTGMVESILDSILPSGDTGTKAKAAK